MSEKIRRDFCIECRKETEYFLQKKDIIKNIKDKEYTFAITVAVCAECGEEMGIPGLIDVPGDWVRRGDDSEISGRTDAFQRVFGYH